MPVSLPLLLPLPRPRLLSAWFCCDMLFFHLYILLPKVLHPRETPAPSEGGCPNYKWAFNIERCAQVRRKRKTGKQVGQNVSLSIPGQCKLCFPLSPWVEPWDQAQKALKSSKSTLSSCILGFSSSVICLTLFPLFVCDLFLPCLYVSKSYVFFRTHSKMLAPPGSLPGFPSWIWLLSGLSPFPFLTFLPVIVSSILVVGLWLILLCEKISWSGNNEEGRKEGRRGETLWAWTSTSWGGNTAGSLASFLCLLLFVHVKCC